MQAENTGELSLIKIANTLLHLFELIKIIAKLDLGSQIVCFDRHHPYTIKLLWACRQSQDAAPIFVVNN